MSVGVELINLIAYTDHERSKWKTWLSADASRLAIPFQNARFSTIGSLFNHVFWVEERHLARLEGNPVPETTGAPENDVNALFDYADRVRGNLRRFITSTDDAHMGAPFTMSLKGGPTFTVRRRKLAAHILLHEIRHFAQIAYAVRAAGHEPPGEHDYFFSPVDQ